MKKTLFTFSILGALLIGSFSFAQTIQTPQINDFHFDDLNFVFKTDPGCKTDLSYISKAGRETSLEDNSYRESHDIVLWNLEFTSYEYELKVTDSYGNATTQKGDFKVTPTDPDLAKKIEAEEKAKEMEMEENNLPEVLKQEKALSEMTRQELLIYLTKVIGYFTFETVETSEVIVD